MHQLLESLRQNSSLRSKKIRRFIPRQISGALPTIGHALSRGVDRINYYGGFGTTLAAVVAFFTLFFVVAQIKSLKEHVKLTGDQLKITEHSLQVTKNQLETSLVITRPFLNPTPFFNVEGNTGAVCYGIANTGNIPARIVFSAFMLWRNGKSLPLKADQQSGLSVIYPHQPFRGQCGVLMLPSELKPTDRLKRLQGRKECVEFSTCIIYESIDKNDPRRWQVDIRNTIGELGKFPAIHADENPVSKETHYCEIGLPQVCK